MNRCTSAVYKFGLRPQGTFISDNIPRMSASFCARPTKHLPRLESWTPLGHKSATSRNRHNRWSINITQSSAGSRSVDFGTRSVYSTIF